MSRPKGVLWQNLLAPGTLENAWGGVLARYPRADRPAPIEQFARDAPQRLSMLRQQLDRGTYVPEPAALLEIPKPNKPGETRPISILRPEDRIVLSALHRVVEPLLEKQFPDGSHAYRRGRGVSSCVRAVELALRSGFRHVAGADIFRYFENIPRAALLARFGEFVWERPILELLEVYLAMGSVVHRRGLPEWVQGNRGIAQGSPFSPLLANLYLLPFDRFLDAGAGTPAESLRWVRYADNYLLFTRERDQAATANDAAIAFLKRELQLEVNGDSKILTGDRDGFLFLGFLIQDGKRRLSPAKVQEMSTRLRTEARAVNARPLPGLRQVSDTVEGWRRYYENALEPETWAHFDALLTDELRRWVGRMRDKADNGVAIRGEALEEALRAVTTPVMRDEREKASWVKQVLAPRREPAPATATAKPVGAPVTSERARKAAAQRKRELEQTRIERMELLITQPGTYLGRRGERVSIRREGRETEQIPLRSVRHITILESGVSLSGELIAEAAAQEIEIHLLVGHGRPDVRIGAAAAPQYHLSLLQLRAAESTLGLDLAKRFLVAKVGNQENLLRYFLKYRGRANGGFLPQGEAAVAEMETIQRQLKTREWVHNRQLDEQERRTEQDRLFAMEGQAAACYWKALGELLRSRAPFPGRERRGAKDLVNSLLNYGYGILYSRLLEILIRSGLNPNISFLHAPRPGKPTLLFDVIEEFRPPAVDRVVCALMGRGVNLELDRDGVGLTTETRRVVARAILDNLQTGQRYRGNRVTLQNIMREQIRHVVRHLKEEEPYRGFVMPW